jgi:tRNA uridine 5-carbamoylmethylation protein Kti12
MSTPEKDLIKKLEKEGEEAVKSILNDKSKKVTADSFLDIMKKGSEEFKQKTGRPMTYSEMREAYG